MDDPCNSFIHHFHECYQCVNDSLTAISNYVTEVSLTGTSLSVYADSRSYFHVPIKFRYAIVLCRFVTSDGQGRYFTAIAYSNYLDINQMIILDKHSALGDIAFQIGTSDGLPVFIVVNTGYVNTTLRECKMTMLMRKTEG